MSLPASYGQVKRTINACVCLEREDMNLKDCINIIKNCTMLACEYHIKDKCNYGYEVRENRFECAKEQAIEALERQIPKKHDIDIFDYGSGYVCGKCGELLLYMDDDDERFRTNYCCHCGQKIDW